MTLIFKYGVFSFFCFQGVLISKVFHVPCSSGQCTLQYSKREDGVFLLSTSTGVGEEVLWDFVSLVKSCRMSFTGFCQEMTRKYATTTSFSTPFMSCKTWVKLFFLWVAAFDLDFREEIDPWCKEDPSLLAYDGTHIRVSIKHMDLDPPITDADKDGNKKTVNHKR